MPAVVQIAALKWAGFNIVIPLRDVMFVTQGLIQAAIVNALL